MTPNQKTEHAIMRDRGYVPVAEAARWAHRHVSRIYVAIDEGKLEGAYAGSNRYVKWTSFLDWMNRRDPLATKLLGIPTDVPEVRE